MKLIAITLTYAAYTYSYLPDQLYAIALHCVVDCFVLACWFFISQHVTNVKGLHVDLMQPVMPRENAPAIKVSKEMDSGVMVGGTLKIFR